MGYNRRVLELELHSWELEESGQLSDRPLTLMSELMYPRPLISLRDHSVAVPHRIGDPVDWSDEPLHRRLLFKEIVEGPFSIGITIKRGQARSLLGSVIPGTIEEAGVEAVDELAGQLGGPAVSAALETLGELGLEQMFSTSEQEEMDDVIANGVIELDTREEVTDQTVEIPVSAPMKISNPEPNPHPERHSDFEEVLKQSGESNGTVTLKYSIFDR